MFLRKILLVNWGPADLWPGNNPLLTRSLFNTETSPSFLGYQCFLVQALLVRSSQNDKSLYIRMNSLSAYNLSSCETSESAMKLYIQNWNSSQIFAKSSLLPVGWLDVTGLQWAPAGKDFFTYNVFRNFTVNYLHQDWLLSYHYHSNLHYERILSYCHL